MSKQNISDEVKFHIVKNLIEPSYIDDITANLSGKKCWKITGQVFETFSKILVALGGIFSFSSGYYNDTTLSFVAGAISTCSLAMLQFSSFSYREFKKQGIELNTILTKLNLDTLPDVSFNENISMLPMMKKKDDNKGDYLPQNSQEKVLIEEIKELQQRHEHLIIENENLRKFIDEKKENSQNINLT